MNRLNLITLGTKDIVKSHNFFKELGFDTSIEERNQILLLFSLGMKEQESPYIL